MEKDAQSLLVKFKIEEHRLLNWAKLVQLDYTEERLVLNHMSRGLILDILDQQRKLLASFGRLDARYGPLRAPLLSETTEIFEIDSKRLLENETSIADLRERTVQFPPAEDLVLKALDWMNKTRAIPKRIRWATWDHKKMESLIVKLSGFNDKMHEALDKAQMESLLEMQTRTNYQIVLLNRQMENMVQLWQSDRIAYRPQGMITELEDSEYDLLYGIPGRNIRTLTQPLGALAQQKFVHLAIEDAQYVSEEYGDSIGLPHLADNIGDTEILLSKIRTKNGEPFPDDIEEGDRTEAVYGSISVWIEWKPNDVVGPSLPDGQVDPKIRSRVQKLAALLKQNNRTVRFRAPHCLGYFVDESEDRESRCGLVFEKPPKVPDQTEPTSLRSLIEASNTPESTTDIPSLTDRILLMRLLADTVERLHAVDWLHKGLRSANILFFKKIDETGEDTVNFADPYVSGFDYSRPATSDDLTERPTDNPAADIYRHPTVQSTGNREESEGRESYKKSYDLYSLGIVLLEIAYWKTIDQILGIDLANAKAKQIWPVKERLLKKEPQHLKFVKSHLGNTVEGVIRACLEGPEAFGLPKDCDEKRGLVAAALQTAFGEQVVKRLASMKGL